MKRNTIVMLSLVLKNKRFLEFLFVLGCDDCNTRGLGDEIHGGQFVSRSNDRKSPGITCLAREIGGRLGSLQKLSVGTLI